MVLRFVCWFFNSLKLETKICVHMIQLTAAAIEHPLFKSGYQEQPQPTKMAVKGNSSISAIKMERSK